MMRIGLQNKRPRTVVRRSTPWAWNRRTPRQWPGPAPPTDARVRHPSDGVYPYGRQDHCVVVVVDVGVSSRSLQDWFYDFDTISYRRMERTTSVVPQRAVVLCKPEFFSCCGAKLKSSSSSVAGSLQILWLMMMIQRRVQ